MPTIQELEQLLVEPREDLSKEYKGWLNLAENEHRAVLAKAAIALINHGGGFIVLGMDEEGANLVSVPRPADVPEITQDTINAAVQRYATPEFHCEMYQVPHPDTGTVHPVIAIPPTLTEPVMSRRGCDGVIVVHRCYIRKPGPRSEGPQTGEEWRSLLRRCLRAGREDMLDAIRTIVSGRAEVENPTPDVLQVLSTFTNEARDRWQELVGELPEDSPSRLPFGFYEMSFNLVDAAPVSLTVLRNRLREARSVKLTGWTPFLEMTTEGWAPYLHEDFIEAWVGRHIRADSMEREPSHCDFWRVSADGKLYTVRGYAEDSHPRVDPSSVIDVTLPVWRVGEGLLFAKRLADTFDDVGEIAVQVSFTGLAGRHLTSIDHRREMMGDDVSNSDNITVTAQVTLSQIEDNLAEVLQPLLVPFYERFSFFELPFFLVEEELDRMLRNRF